MNLRVTSVANPAFCTDMDLHCVSMCTAASFSRHPIRRTDSSGIRTQAANLQASLLPLRHASTLFYTFSLQEKALMFPNLTVVLRMSACWNEWRVFIRVFLKWFGNLGNICMWWLEECQTGSGYFSGYFWHLCVVCRFVNAFVHQNVQDFIHKN